jgi:hypothetical protein
MNFGACAGGAELAAAGVSYTARRGCRHLQISPRHNDDTPTRQPLEKRSGIGKSYSLGQPQVIATSSIGSNCVLSGYCIEYMSSIKMTKGGQDRHLVKISQNRNSSVLGPCRNIANALRSITKVLVRENPLIYGTPRILFPISTLVLWIL